LDGRFLLLDELGRGGMSTVFKAVDLANAGCLVAVKIPLPQYSSGLGSWSMFQREAEIGASLNHPFIVRFIPVAQTKQNYVVTEYVIGAPLSERVGHGRPLAEPEALRIASLVCEAVAYLHDQRVVHYDLKPGNVMVREDGTIKLIDFGMAHQVVEGRFAFAGSAPAIASSDYVAPEQLRRVRGRPSVDIYALGAMLYEMLTGHPPFEGDDPFVLGSARQIGDPRALRALNPNISPQTEEIVLRAMRREPSERYPTVWQLKADLDQPTRVRVSGLSERLIEATPGRRRLRVARFVGLVTVAPVAILVAAFRLLWWCLERRP
jgi:serine/threonine protein kinase